MDAGGVDLWGGVECTVCRIGERYVDQTIASGHHVRADDLDLIASLGLTHLRYPVLWERVAPEGLRHADWTWTDERLHLLRERNITPIVTLLHHGSGPRDTNLLDPLFAEKLAEFGGAVARRYPWLRYFTPVNEPGTTARFSALYGWWYPHARDDRSFYTALINQISGIRKAMDAIRAHIPQAQLVTTEDLGKTYSTPSLHYQAAYENARRLLSYDLLCGTLDENPQMRAQLGSFGFPIEALEKELRCEPAILGFNYYVTGERWLDERLDLYPNSMRGGNGRDEYVDVEAVRVRRGAAGARTLLQECWNRYRRPMAIMEAHLACSHDEQIRWLRDLYCDAAGLRRSGVDLRAVTVWSLLGAFDWNSMLTRQDGYYETGAFDVSGGVVKETPLGSFVRTLARAPELALAQVHGQGWWRQPARLSYAEPESAASAAGLEEGNGHEGVDRTARLCGSHEARTQFTA